MSGASEASTGAAPPVDASANAPDSSPCPLPSYRQFVQEALAGIIKVGDHAEPVDAYRSSDSYRSSLASSPRGAGVSLRQEHELRPRHQILGGWQVDDLERAETGKRRSIRNISIVTSGSM